MVMNLSKNLDIMFKLEKKNRKIIIHGVIIRSFIRELCLLNRRNNVIDVSSKIYEIAENIKLAGCIFKAPGPST